MADLLIDEGIGRHFADALRAQGFRAHHALEFFPKGAHDQLVFLEAQRRGPTVFTWNHGHYKLLAEAWRDWGLGDHHGVITRPDRQPQLANAQLLPLMVQYCADAASYINRIELF
jgi:hypothetical protein